MSKFYFYYDKMVEEKSLPERDDKVEKKYTRTLQFIFIKATLDLYPNSKITIQHSIGKGIFGEVFKEKPLDKNDIKKIKDKYES